MNWAVGLDQTQSIAYAEHMTIDWESWAIECVSKKDVCGLATYPGKSSEAVHAGGYFATVMFHKFTCHPDK
jgi:hypothetical protein